MRQKNKQLYNIHIKVKLSKKEADTFEKQINKIFKEIHNDKKERKKQEKMNEKWNRKIDRITKKCK